MNTDEEFGVHYAWLESSVMFQTPAKPGNCIEREKRGMDADWKAMQKSKIGPG